LLAEGVEAVAEPQRKDFYEVQNGFNVFYIHLCPNGKVLLLAMWSRDLHVAPPAENYLRASSAM
jgi:hypothetical protein